MDECKIILMGFGSVGQGVAKSIYLKKNLIKQKTGVSVKIVAAADSSTSAICQDGLDEELLIKTKTEKGKLDEYIKNLERYIESPHFLNYREIDKKLFREGRAEELPKEITVPIRPWPIIYTYLKSQDVMEVGPLVTINVDGMVTECDASIEHQRTLYNYGNILDENLESIITRVGEEVSPRTWYRKTGKIIKKQTTYNR